MEGDIDYCKSDYIERENARVRVTRDASLKKCGTLAREQDSNLRPQAYETCKLTNCSTPHCSASKGKDI